MIKTKHRVASALLVLLLTLGTWAGLLVLAPVTAQAAVGNYIVYVGATTNERATVATLLEAFEAAQNGDTIAIGAPGYSGEDISDSLSQFSLHSGKNITLDVSKASAGSDGTPTLTLEWDWGTLEFFGSGSLTVVGGTLCFFSPGLIELESDYTLQTGTGQTGTGGYIRIDGPALNVISSVARVTSLESKTAWQTALHIMEQSGGSTVSVAKSITSVGPGIDIRANEVEVVVGGDVISTQEEGIRVSNGSKGVNVTVKGNVISAGNERNGISVGAMGAENVAIQVEGNVATDGIGIWARYGTVQVDGDVTSASRKAIHVETGGTVSVGGDASGPEGVVVEIGGGTVTIDGALLGTTTNYVQFVSWGGTANLPASDGRSEGGYLQVFDQNSPTLTDHPDVDWSKHLVRIGKVVPPRAPIQGVLANNEPEAPQPSPEQPAQPASPQTGDSGALLVWLAILCAGLAVACIAARRWQSRPGKT